MSKRLRDFEDCVAGGEQIMKYALAWLRWKIAMFLFIAGGRVYPVPQSSVGHGFWVRNKWVEVSLHCGSRIHATRIHLKGPARVGRNPRKTVSVREMQ